MRADGFTHPLRAHATLPLARRIVDLDGSFIIAILRFQDRQLMAPSRVALVFLHWAPAWTPARKATARTHWGGVVVLSETRTIA
jgi:hypothetical protein